MTAKEHVKPSVLWRAYSRFVQALGGPGVWRKIFAAAQLSSCLALTACLDPGLKSARRREPPAKRLTSVHKKSQPNPTWATARWRPTMTIPYHLSLLAPMPGVRSIASNFALDWGIDWLAQILDWLGSWDDNL